MVIDEKLPPTWRWVTLEEIQAPSGRAIVSGPFGSNIGARFFVDSGIPVIRGNNLTTDMTRFVDSGFVFLTDEKAKEFKNCEALPNDLVFTAAGTLGQVGLIPDNGKFSRYIISNKQLRARLDENQVFPLFAFYWLSSREMVQYIQQRNTGSTVPLINLSVLKSLPIPLPPLPEQRAIADVLGALDDKIELNRRMNETLEGLARALFKSWFVDFDPVRRNAERRMTNAQPDPRHPEDALFPAAFEGDIPQGWRVEEIGKTVKVVGGSTPSTKNPEFWDGEYHWATPKDLSTLHSPILLDTERKITKAGIAQISSGILPAGTLLMSSRAPVGYLAISEIPVSINQGFIGMVCDGDLPNYYVLHWAQTNMEAIQGRANGTTFMEISKSNFRPMPVIVPSVQVLQKFVEQVEPLYKKISANLQQSRTLAALRDALLPRLMSGEVRVKGVSA